MTPAPLWKKSMANSKTAVKSLSWRFSLQATTDSAEIFRYTP